MRSLIKAQTEQGNNLELWPSSSLLEDGQRNHDVDESYETIDLNSQFTTSWYVNLTRANETASQNNSYWLNFRHSWFLTQCLITEETAPSQTAQLVQSNLTQLSLYSEYYDYDVNYQGQTMRDSVCIHDNTDPKRCVFVEFFNLTEHYTFYNTFYNKCGEIGIAPVDKTQPATSFVYTLYDNSLIAEPVITFANTN